MKREIKFRGKLLKNGEWCYGSLLIWEDGECYILEKSDSSYAVWKREIAPDTVGQFTGLHDANGKEIYEGDVIIEDKDPTILEIVFRDGIFFAAIGNTRGENPFMNCALRVILDRRKTYIIGNIYDNPELLKGGQDEQTAK